MERIGGKWCSASRSCCRQAGRLENSMPKKAPPKPVKRKLYRFTSRQSIQIDKAAEKIFSAVFPLVGHLQTRTSQTVSYSPMNRAQIIFMISLVPAKMRVTRMSRHALAMGYSSQYP
jgi:hypothetical protein